MKHYKQLSATSLFKYLQLQKNCQKTALGAHAITTGKFTGRAPKDRFIVFDSKTKDSVWWGSINKPISTNHYNCLRDDFLEELNSKTVFVRESFIGADPNYRIKVKTTVEQASSDLFIRNMFIPIEKDTASFSNTSWELYCMPSFEANPQKHGTRSENFVIINFTTRSILIGGTGYTGEIKKSLFTVMNFLMPLHHNVLPMHCSATCSDNNDRTSIFFGLSGTGKTTLSADKKRKLIGDDEHGWTPKNTIFNFEGGCYAKVWKIDKEKEPSIYKAIRRGALLENVVVKKDQTVDFEDASITENTRVSYPLRHIENVKTPAIGSNPKHLFFLSADAFGVLPPLALLSPDQAAYHFISGYTAKIAGTETGVTEPEPHFSACFGAPFMPLHPKVYASLLEEKIRAHNTCVWLVNTGWIGGSYTVGHRIPLRYTRSLIDGVINNKIDPKKASHFKTHEVFQFQQLTQFNDIPSHVLNPREGWKNDAAYDRQAQRLAKSFHLNFEQYKDQVISSISQAGPIVQNTENG